MRSVVLAQLRHHPGRYVATALAIVLGTAFVAVGFLFTSTLRDTLGNALVADLAHADVVVGPRDASARSSLTEDQVRAVTSTPGVAASLVLRTTSADAELPLVGRQGVEVRSVASDPRLRSQRVTAGRVPRGPAEIAIGADAARATGLHPGSSVTLGVYPDTTSAAATSAGATGIPAPQPAGPTPHRYTVVGVLDGGSSINALGSGLLFFLPDTRPLPGVRSAVGVGLLAAPGVGAQQLSAAAAARLATSPGAAASEGPAGSGAAGSGGPGGDALAVSTMQQYRAASVAQIRLVVQLIGAFVLAFAILAMAVAGLVIANTFVILLTARTRELALLRCVGAVRRQVFRSVLAEAAVLGGVASALGIVLAWGLSAGAVAIANTFPLPLVIATPIIGWQAVVLPLVIGITVTVLASLAPARRATAVPPVAALRQDLGLAVRNRRGMVRLILGLLGVGVGVLGILGGLAVGEQFGVVLTALGVAVSFIGLLAAARLYIPPVARLVGSLVRVVGGVPGRLGVLNVLRNPARATATCTALVIGVTLVCAVGVGAATARASALRVVLADNPVDVVAYTGSSGYLNPGSLAERQAQGDTGDQPQALGNGVADKVAGVAGITGVATLTQAPVDVRLPGGYQLAGTASGADPALIARVAREDVARDLGPDTIIFGARYYKEHPVKDGQRVTVTGSGGQSRTLTVRLASGLPVGVLLDRATLAALSRTPPVTAAVWARTSALDSGGAIDSVGPIVDRVRAAVGNAPAGGAFAGPTSDVVQIEGGAQQAAAIVRVLNALVKVLTALLAMALIIALVGIANTLSLSVLERSRESGLLRALGLGRGALRAAIAWEAVTLALVAAGLGLALGIGYAWVGSRAIFSGASSGRVQTVFTIPVGQTLLLVAIAVLAGLLASVLPARRAAATAPARVLAQE